jgi:SAM-dependent methyltransferase
MGTERPTVASTNHDTTCVLTPFGAEYGYRPAWGFLQRCYIRAFGVIDLPSRLRARIVLQQLAKFGCGNLLDFGCGTGCYSFYLTRRAQVRVSGVDSNENRVNDCIAIANKISRKNLTFISGSGHNGLLPFDSKSFDAILAVEVLQYVPDPLRTLREMYRLLAPGGHLIGHVPMLGYLREGEQTLFDDANLSATLEETGFENVSITRTFGGGVRHACKAFEWASRSRVIAALVFPFLLAASSMCGIASPHGDYRLFSGHKPFSDAACSGSMGRSRTCVK